jgi:hypothetical protein
MQTLTATPPEATQPIAPTAVPVAPQTIVVIPVRSRAARAHIVIARILLGGVTLQIFFAGLGVFGVSSFLPHMMLGTLVILGSLALPLVAWRGHLGATLHHRSWLVFGLMILQGLLIDAGRIIPLVAAFHPVNAMLLVLLVASMACITREH